MKLLQLAFAPLLIGACAAGAQTFPATAPSVSSPPADQSSFPQRYDVLTERNIFLRDRRRPSQPAPSSVPVSK